MNRPMILSASVRGLALATAAHPDGGEVVVVTREPIPRPDAAPPQRLSNDPNHPDFHPSYNRVGVRIDGAERRDCIWYNAPAGRYLTLGTGRNGARLEAQSIEPFWRWAESRQERRARERWEGKRK